MGEEAGQVDAYSKLSDEQKTAVSVRAYHNWISKSPESGEDKNAFLQAEKVRIAQDPDLVKNAEAHLQDVRQPRTLKLYKQLDPNGETDNALQTAAHNNADVPSAQSVFEALSPREKTAVSVEAYTRLIKFVKDRGIPQEKNNRLVIFREYIASHPDDLKQAISQLNEVEAIQPKSYFEQLPSERQKLVKKYAAQLWAEAVKDQDPLAKNNPTAYIAKEQEEIAGNRKLVDFLSEEKKHKSQKQDPGVDPEPNPRGINHFEGGAGPSSPKWPSLRDLLPVDPGVDLPQDHGISPNPGPGNKPIELKPFIKKPKFNTI